MYRFRTFFATNTTAHKWLVFVFDTILGVVAFTMALYLVNLAGLQPAEKASTGLQVGMVAVTCALFFLFFRTNEIAPGPHNFKSALRSIDALSGSFIALMLLNIGMKLTGKAPIVPNVLLITSTFLSVLLIGGYRFVAALFSRRNETTGNRRQAVAVYGSDLHFAEIKESLETMPGQQYKVTALFLQKKSKSKAPGDVGTYSYNELAEVISNKGVDLLLFAGNHLPEEEKNRVVDICLDHNIVVKNLPSFDHWIGGNVAVSHLRDVSIEELLGKRNYYEHDKPVLQLVASRRILITGAAGSIGSELARQIAGLKHTQLLLADQHETGLYELEYELSKLGAKPVCFVGDVRDERAMENIFKQYEPQVVFHAAAYKHVPMMEANPSEAVRNNVAGTTVMADLSVKYNAERFLLVSTDKAINPTNVMGASKRIAEMYVQSLAGCKETAGMQGTRFITTRFGNVLGSNGSVIPRFAEQIAAGGPVTVTHPDIVRYFMTISEACALVLDAVTMGKGGEVFRFDMGEPVKILDLATKMIRLAGYKPDADVKITYCGLRPGEKLYEEMLQKEQETQTAHNKKILVSKMNECDCDVIHDEIDKLLKLAAAGRDEEVVKQMKRMIPEYISNNSVFQSFDEKKLAVVNR